MFSSIAYKYRVSDANVKHSLDEYCFANNLCHSLDRPHELRSGARDIDCMDIKSGVLHAWTIRASFTMGGTSWIVFAVVTSARIASSFIHGLSAPIIAWSSPWRCPLR